MLKSVYLALGSNMGDREGNLIDAIKSISLINNTFIKGLSGVYETNPVGYANQENFFNMVIRVETGAEPLVLLKELQNIEDMLKRKREIRWGPRTIDIDILMFEDIKLDLPELTIPHPRMFERAFVLIPLRDVYYNKLIKGSSIDELINNCEDRDGVRLIRKLIIDG